MYFVVTIVLTLIFLAAFFIIIGFSAPWWGPWVEAAMDWVERQSNRVPARKRKNDETFGGTHDSK